MPQAGKLRTYYRSLSGGQKRRLSIALALIGSPRLAVLDEMTSGPGPQARRGTWALIESVRDRGVTILVIIHFMEEAERLWDRVAVIDGGRVVATDTPAGLALTRADDDGGTPMTRDSQEPPAAGTNKASPPPSAAARRRTGQPGCATVRRSGNATKRARIGRASGYTHR